MSLIIKGMDMPKKGVYHAVITFDGDSLGVRIPPSKEPFFLGRIVHMPTPHGRLIDADKLVWFIDNHIAAGKKWVEFETIKDMINSLPTIIEAEVSE